MEQIEKALQLKTQLDTLRPIDPEREAIIMQKFRLDWDYHSNHLEGNSLTYGETKALILFGITAQGKPLKDHFEITGHDEAIKWVMEIVKQDYPLTEVFIRELHLLLLKNPYDTKAITPDGQDTIKRVEVGKYKTTPNHVKTRTGEIFRFATPEETPALMQELIDWYRVKKDSPDVNPVILAAEFHYRFIRIHPFDDGNGRIARILMNFILMQFGYPPVIIKTGDKGNYFSALQQADSGIIEPFFEYIAANLVRSLEIMIAGAKGESIEEPDDWDKELALLEQKLKTIGKKTEKYKTKETALDIYNGSVKKLTRIFISECEKFNKFYVENTFNLYINNQGVGVNRASGDALNKDGINENLNLIVLNYSYIGFNLKGFGEFSYSSRIEIEFKLTTYIIKLSQNKGVFEKTYDEQLLDTEADEIVKKEVRLHKEYIEYRATEIQNKKP